MNKYRKLLIPALVIASCCIFGCVMIPAAAYLIGSPVQVDGQSMSPNYHSGEIWFTRRSNNIERAQVHVVTIPGRAALVKRVIGLPGETVKIDNGRILIDGKIIDESDYIASGIQTKSATFIKEDESYQIPGGHYFLLGDNRGNSMDSRYTEVGFVAEKYIGAELWSRLK
jgi:signal peptidase I